MAADEKRVALVIGNSAYVNAMPLKNPRNDAEAMGRVLGRLGFEVISSIDLGRDAMEDKLVEFEGAIGGASAAMLFYAGHGLQVKGRNYLIPVDADIRQEIQLKRRAFSLDELLDIMVRRARASLIFLDACRDNPFSRSLLSGMSDEEQKRYLIRSGLAEVKTSQGSFIAFATAPDNVAYDGKGANSPFTEALVAHIEAPGVSVSDMMIEVRKDVLRATDGAQEPWDQSSLRERFCFMSAGVPPRPEDGGAIDDRAIEYTYWLNIQSSHDPCTYEGFLAKFENGDYAVLAKTRAEESIKACRDPETLERLLREHSASDRAALAWDRLEELSWHRAKRSGNHSDIEAFLDRWPIGRFATEAKTRMTTQPISQEGKADRIGISLRLKGAALAVIVAASAVAGVAVSRLRGSGEPPVQVTYSPPVEELSRDSSRRNSPSSKPIRDRLSGGEGDGGTDTASSGTETSSAVVTTTVGRTLKERIDTALRDAERADADGSFATIPEAQGGTGAYFAQIGARSDHAQALAAFNGMQRKYASVLGIYSPSVRRADMGDKGIWYRVRVGPFGSQDEADKLCEELKTAGLKSCFSVRD